MDRSHIGVSAAAGADEYTVKRQKNITEVLAAVSQQSGSGINSYTIPEGIGLLTSTSSHKDRRRME